MSSSDILGADMATVGRWIAGAARWWLDELGAMVPPVWRARLRVRALPMRWRPGTGALWPISEADDAPAAGAPIAVWLPAELCLIRSIERPLVSRRDLTAMIELEADRIMPMTGGAMILAGRITARDAAAGRMQAEVAGLPLAAAEALAEALRLTAGTPQRVLVGEPAQDASEPIDMLPALRRAGLVATPGGAAVALWLVVGFLFALNIALLIWRDSANLAQFEDMVAQQQPAVDIAHGIAARSRAVNRLAADTGAARRNAEPLALLARIDGGLPPGAWLQRLSWQGDLIKLSGFRPPRTDVSAALRAAGLAVVRYGDSATSGATPLGQPFEITVRVAASGRNG